MVITPTATELPDRSDLPPLPLPVEISIVLKDDFLDHPRGGWPRFALAHCGWTLTGSDLLTNLPPPRLGDVAIAHLRNVRRWWPCRPLDWSPSLAMRRLTLQWLAKRIVRALAEGPMVRQGVYSRDIWPCLQIASATYPHAAADLRLVASQAVWPDGAIGTFGEMVRRTRPLLIEAHRRHLHRRLDLPT
ncbi:MAG: hypothetical protein AAF253_02450 [Pseudomonadota bacterium]